MIKLKPLAEHYSNQYLIPFIDYHLVFFYKYFNDVKHLKQMEEGILLNYKNTGFKASTSKYLSPIIKSLRSTEIINEEILFVVRDSRRGKLSNTNPGFIPKPVIVTFELRAISFNLEENSGNLKLG